MNGVVETNYVARPCIKWSLNCFVLRLRLRIKSYLGIIVFTEDLKTIYMQKSWSKMHRFYRDRWISLPICAGKMKTFYRDTKKKCFEMITHWLFFFFIYKNICYNLSMSMCLSCLHSHHRTSWQRNNTIFHRTNL